MNCDGVDTVSNTFRGTATTTPEVEEECSDDDELDSSDVSGDSAPEAPPRTRRKSEPVPNLEEVVLVTAEDTKKPTRPFIPVYIRTYVHT